MDRFWADSKQKGLARLFILSRIATKFTNTAALSLSALDDSNRQNQNNKVTQSLFIYRHAALHVYHWAAVLRLTMWSLSAISPTQQPPWTKKGHPPKISWTSLRYIKCNAHIVKKAKAQHHWNAFEPTLDSFLYPMGITVSSDNLRNT